MNPKSINAKNITPTTYKHVHDSKLLFRSYRENFDFGLIVDQYYFHDSLKDKKTNYNTQYTLTNVMPLSTIVELDIPHYYYNETEEKDISATRTFVSTIKYEDNYLSAGEQFVASTDYDQLSEDFFYTFNITAVAPEHGGITYGSDNPQTKNVERVIISQVRDSITYYLKAPNTQNTNATWVAEAALAAEPDTFPYAYENNYISIFSPKGSLTTGPSANVAVLSATGSGGEDVLHWKEPGAWQNSVSELSATWLTASKKNLTETFYTLPNSYVKYITSFNTDTVDIDTTTITEHLSNNYIVFSNNYNFYTGKENIPSQICHVDFFPLKNQATLHEFYAKNNHFNQEPDYLNRVYDKIHSGAKQQRGLDKVGLSYNIGTYDLVFEPNKLTYFTTPSSIAPYTKLNIADSKLDTLGATPGDTPIMSDKVFKKRAPSKNNSYSDDTDPTFLCSWLSGNSNGETKWVDRYYNPRISTFSDALSTNLLSAIEGTNWYDTVTQAGAATTETFDVSSSLTFEPNNDYSLYHIGDKDYENLFNVYNTTYNTASSIEYLTHKGVPVIPEKFKNEDVLDLNGENFGRFNATIEGDFSTSFWLETQNNSLPFAHMIAGNYFEDGFGIFNTDLVTPNIILPVENTNTGLVSKLLFLNNDFEIYDEVIVQEDGVDVKIIGLGRKDIYSELYVLGENKIIYIYNSNNNLVGKIEDLKDSAVTIDDFEVAEDDLYVLFNPVANSQYFKYNFENNASNNITSSTATAVKGEKGKIIKTDKGVSVLSVDSDNGYGNEIAVDTNEDIYTIRRNSPTSLSDTRNYLQKGSIGNTNSQYTNTNKIIAGVSIASKVNGVQIDDENNIIVLHDNSKISILNDKRQLLRTRDFCDMDNFAFEQSYIDLIYDFEDGVYKKYILYMQEMDGGFSLIKLDSELNIVNVKEFSNLNLGDLNLTKSVTSYYYLNKIKANKNRFKVILKTKARFSASGVLNRKKTVIDFDITQLNSGYNHFYINTSLRKGYVELYVNGRLFQKKEFKAGKYALDNVLGTGFYIGAVSTPFYLTLANRLLQPKKYFTKNCKIKSFKLYNKVMSYYDILAHYNYHFKDKNLIWSYPLGQRTYIDTIDKLMKFTYPEKPTNKYSIEIKNTGIEDSELKNTLTEKINTELQKITPYYDKSQDVTIS